MSQTWIPNTSGELDSDDTLSDSRTYINDALEALRSSWSGASAPSAPVVGQWFIDTDTNLVSMWNGASWKVLGDADADYFGLLALAGGTMAGAIAMGTNKITGLGTPTASADAATKNYVDTTALLLAGGTMAGNIVMGANDVTSDHNPTLTTHLARKAYVDLFLPLAGGTMSGSVAMGGYKLTGLGAGTAGSNDTCRMAEFSAAFDTSTGHDHSNDAGDGKKVNVTSLDATGQGNGAYLVCNASGIQPITPWGVDREAGPSITGSYADIVEVTLYVPRTTTTLYGLFTCIATVTNCAADDYAILDVRVLNAANATQREKTTALEIAGNGTTETQAIPLTFAYYWVPGAAGNETFTVQVKKTEQNCTIAITDAVLWVNTIG